MMNKKLNMRRQDLYMRRLVKPKKHSIASEAAHKSGMNSLEYS